MSLPQVSTITAGEAAIVQNALGLQIASYRRKLNENLDDDLRNYYQQKLATTEKLALNIVDILVPIAKETK